MAWTATNTQDNEWECVETDDDGNMTQSKTVFCKASENTEAAAIALASYVPTGD